MIPNPQKKFNSRSQIACWIRAVLLVTATGWVSAGLDASETFPLGILGGTGTVSPKSTWIQIETVADDSAGKLAGLQVGDRLVGLNDTSFTPHSAKVDAGGSGPQKSLGETLDFIASQKEEKDRTLSLKIRRPSEENPEGEALTLSCSLPHRPSLREQAGVDLLILNSRKQLLRALKPAGYWDAPVGLTGDRVLTAWACVALLATQPDEDKNDLTPILKWLQGPEGRAWIPEDPKQKGPDNLGNWALTATAVALSEAQLINPTEENAKVIQTICDALRARMDEQGMFGHDVVTGYRGKGFNVINTLSHMAWSISEIAGAKIPEEAWNLSLEQIRQSIDPNGGIRYWSLKIGGTADASLRTSSMALALLLKSGEEKLKDRFCNYLDQYRARTREAHAVGSMGMLLAPAVLWQHDRQAYQRFVDEWRWYLALTQNHRGQIRYIGGKKNNGGDGYLGKHRMACAIALMMLSPPQEKLRLFRSE